MTRLLNKTLFIRAGICLAFIVLLGTVIHTQKLDTSHNTVRSEKIDPTQQHQNTPAFSTQPEQMHNPPTSSGDEKTPPNSVSTPEEMPIIPDEVDTLTQKMPLQPAANQPISTEPPLPSQVSPKDADIPTNDSAPSTDAQNTTDIDAELKRFQNSDFYRTIIDNNLFQSLGTTPAQPTPRYRLICTTTPANEDVGGEALIQDLTNGSPIQRVRLGTIIGNATVVDIQPKQVVLDEKGEQTTLHLQEHLWLSPK